MTETRSYVSPKREAQAAATRTAILEAFAEQLKEPGRDKLSPSEAAARVGVSLRTVHVHFPNEASQVEALAEWLDRQIFPDGVAVASGPDDLVRYYREIHALGLKNPIARVLSTHSGRVWQEVRQRRRVKRIEAIRRAVKAIGAPARATQDATAMLLAISGGDTSWAMHDLYGLPRERVPEAIASTVQGIVDALKVEARKRG